MNKKGFTLVELLAVIAILAILVIIALPNVLGMFNQAKEDTFATETKEMVKIAQQQYLATFGKWTRYATDGSKNGETSLTTVTCTSSTGPKENEYCKIEKEAGNLTTFILTFQASNGQVDTLYATDGTYKYEFDSENGTKEYDATQVSATEIG